MTVPIWSRLRLTPRIVIVILFSLLTAKGVDTALSLLVRPPVVMFFEQTWLIDTLRQSRDAIRAAPEAERPQVLQASLVRDYFDIALAAEPDFNGKALSPAFEALRLSIAQALGLAPQDVALNAPDVRDPEQSLRPIVAILPHLPMVMVDVMDNNSDGLLTSDLRIAARLDAGQWLLVMPKSDGREMARMARNVLLPISVLLVIAIFAALAARDIVRPLDDLAEAAETLGRRREVNLVKSFNAPELQTIGNAFNGMQKRIKQFVDERLQMMAAISHDLRTPLTRIRLFAEYVEDPAQRRQLLSDIEDMEAMVSSTLAFASQQLQTEPQGAVDLAALLISQCDTASDAGKDIAYEGPDHLNLQCQPMAIRRAFANLIDNSCKYADTVAVMLQTTPSEIRVLIRDDGPGIPADQAEAVFQPFMRLEASRNRETGGTGLGLTIARDIIAAHHGGITLAGGDTRAGKPGLTVTVTLSRSA